jgi:hypothetical protein
LLLPETTAAYLTLLQPHALDQALYCCGYRGGVDGAQL